MFLKEIRVGEEYAIRAYSVSTPQRGRVRRLVRVQGSRTRVQVEWLDEDTGTPTGDVAEVYYALFNCPWREHCVQKQRRAERLRERQRTIRALDRLRRIGYEVPDPYGSEYTDVVRADWYSILDSQAPHIPFIALPVTIVENLLVSLGAMTPEERDATDPSDTLRAELAWLESVSLAHA